MDREEAIKIVRNIYQTDAEKEALGTLIPELRESEDERINKAIFKALSKKEARDVLLAEGVQVSDALAYLEKQKETLHISESCKENSDSFTSEDERIRKGLIEYLKADWGHHPSQSARFYASALAYLEKQEQKPAWSEEDEKKIHFLSRLIEFQVKDDEYCFGEGFRMISKQEAIEMLKSLRPSWKPSEEQMDALRETVWVSEKQKILESLYNDLLKLK